MTVSIDQRRAIHRISWDFEDALRRGQQPSIEEILTRNDDVPADILLDELLTTELQWLAEEPTIGANDPTVVGRFADRFPTRRAWIADVWRQCEPPVAIDDTPQHPRYDFLEPIDRGGCGSIWRVYDRHLQRHAAVKFLTDPGQFNPLRERLLREARLCARLEHPYIVPVYELCQFEDGRPLIAMRLIGGKTLAAL